MIRSVLPPFAWTSRPAWVCDGVTAGALSGRFCLALPPKRQAAITSAATIAIPTSASQTAFV